MKNNRCLIQANSDYPSRPPLDPNFILARMPLAQAIRQPQHFRPIPPAGHQL